MRRCVILILLLTFASEAVLKAAEKPKLVVNIVVSQMRYDYLTRFWDNFSDDGFKLFANEGTVFTDAYYNYAQTTTPAALATLTTGASPSLHGIVSERWIDYVTNKTVYLIADEKTQGLDCDYGVGMYSPHNLVVPTLADRMKEDSPKSKVVTIAADPTSAVVMGGHSSKVYWIDHNRCNWISSKAYMPSLPNWVLRYNEVRYANQHLSYKWELSLHRERYVNSQFSVIDMEQPPSRFEKLTSLDFLKKEYKSKEYDQILKTPAGNLLVKNFAKEAFIQEDLGKDEYTDILNICFDTPRYVGEMFGPTSMEVEDMFYRLDQDIAEFIKFVFVQMPRKDVLIVLTSDHGASDSYKNGDHSRDRFNTAHFKMIMNSFMNAQYGTGEWVLDFVDRQLYLNRNMIYKNNLSLEEVQNRVAAFALQFRGVSHVLTATALTGSYFGSSYAQKMQNCFYPRRSGDIVVNLMPGWIVEDERVVSESGSMYDYDTHVPLMMLGSKITKVKLRGDVDMTSVAPTLARVMDINRPIASEGRLIQNITRLYE